MLHGSLAHFTTAGGGVQEVCSRGTARADVELRATFAGGIEVRAEDALALGEVGLVG